MKVWAGLQDLPSLVLRPDHEGVHGPLDVVLPLSLQLLSLGAERARGRSEGLGGLLLPPGLRGAEVEGGGRAGKERETRWEGGGKGGKGK